MLTVISSFLWIHTKQEVISRYSSIMLTEGSLAYTCSVNMRQQKQCIDIFEFDIFAHTKKNKDAARAF